MRTYGTLLSTSDRSPSNFVWQEARRGRPPLSPAGFQSPLIPSPAFFRRRQHQLVSSLPEAGFQSFREFGEERVNQVWNNQANCVAAARRQPAGEQVRAIVEFFDPLQHALPCLFPNIWFVPQTFETVMVETPTSAAMSFSRIAIQPFWGALQGQTFTRSLFRLAKPGISPKGISRTSQRYQQKRCERSQPAHIHIYLRNHGVNAQP